MELITFYFTKSDRELAYNSDQMRKIVKEIIQEKKTKV